MQPYEIEIFSSFSLRAVCRALAPDMELNMDAVMDFMNYPHRYFSQFPGCLQKFNAPRCIVNYWKWSNTIIRYVANEQHVKYLSNWRYKLFTACTAAGTASYVLRDLCRELGGSHEEPLDDVCFPFPHIQEKYAKQNLTKHIVMLHEFMDWCIKTGTGSQSFGSWLTSKTWDNYCYSYFMFDSSYGHIARYAEMRRITWILRLNRYIYMFTWTCRLMLL